MSDPRLPPELERFIFTDALRNHFQDPTDLFLVAKRVREWLIPLAFEVVLIHRLRSFPIQFNTLSDFEAYGPHIRHLLVSRLWSDISRNLDERLAKCPNITNLALWWASPPIRISSIMNLSSLTQLSIDTNYLLKEALATTEVPMFSNITHLDTMGTHAAEKIEEDFTLMALHFPALTHIAFLWGLALFKCVLQQFKSLKALVSWRTGELGIDKGRRSPVDDDRVVMIFLARIGDWENAARGKGPGMWDFVDEVLRKRAEEKAK
ncbi:hypothetical protein BDN72DRAFT_845207 [Pluteus cervinus]|uniref:Uncharacterized protein n=1 Tax=Pluteus cervinus TaxID=181527 RepID=A0ACD3AJR2_9AGAR|nr:hypothetical protein BDN72DRAFT_845207 [Pluteus cervinus]